MFVHKCKYKLKANKLSTKINRRSYKITPTNKHNTRTNISGVHSIHSEQKMGIYSVICRPFPSLPLLPSPSPYSPNQPPPPPLHDRAALRSILSFSLTPLLSPLSPPASPPPSPAPLFFLLFSCPFRPYVRIRL